MSTAEFSILLVAALLLISASAAPPQRRETGSADSDSLLEQINSALKELYSASVSARIVPHAINLI